MTTPASDFDAAKAIVEQLKGIEKERQHRILRWVAESLDLSLHVKLPGTHESHATPDRSTTAEASIQMPTVDARHQTGDIKSFVEAKKPKSDMQFAAVVAYYYRFETRPEEKRETITAEVLQDAARLAGRDRLKKPHLTLNNAKNQGYLDSAGRGAFRINSVGENLVAMTLPGSGGEPRNRPKRKAK